jgi:cysteine desulfurase
MDRCYFDYNATTPLRPEARVAWLAAVDELWLNPSSPYRAAARVRAQLEAARAEFADLFAVAADRVVFNSGATEANNTIFAHWAETLDVNGRVGVSPTEHPSVIESAKRFFGDRVLWLKSDDSGAVDLSELQTLLASGKVAAVSAMAANNESGVLNDWRRIAADCRAVNVPYHCDASQWIGKMPLDGLRNCDFVTGCAHKFGGPRGVGFVLLPEVQAEFVSFVGGAQEAGHRAGTEDVASVLAMLAALKVAEPRDGKGRDAFLHQLKQEMPAVEVIGAEAPRLWNTVLLIVPEFAGVRWIRALEQRGFLVAAGSACSSGKSGASPVLAALGVDSNGMRRVLRVSSGWSTRDEEWLALAEAMVDSYASLRAEADDSTATVISI